MKSMTMYCGATVKETMCRDVAGQEVIKLIMKGYKEQHDLMMMHRPNQAYNGDEQQEDAYSDHPSDDVDAWH